MIANGKLNHYVGVRVYNLRKRQWRHVTPYLEGFSDGSPDGGNTQIGRII